LGWAAKVKLGVTEVVHVIDDFLLLANSFDKCNHDLHAFITMCNDIGVPLAPDKTCGPSTSIQFLGIILDAVHMHARLPEDKLVRARNLLLALLRKQKVTLKELQSVIGLLSFCSEVVVPGRPFLRRLIDLTIGVSRPYFHIRLTKQAKLDVGVWLAFLQHFNGKAFFLDNNFLTGDFLELYTDAAGAIGYGALFGNAWFCGLWPAEGRSHNVVFLNCTLLLQRSMCGVMLGPIRVSAFSLIMKPWSPSLITRLRGTPTSWP
jgi:hypothetical protein